MRDVEDSTPLHSLAPYITEEWFSYLKEREVDLDAIDNSGQTPLRLALTSREAVELFVKHGANKNWVSKEGKTLLDVAIYEGIKIPVLSESYYNTCRYLIEEGVGITKQGVFDIYKEVDSYEFPKDLALSIVEMVAAPCKLAIAARLGLPDEVEKLLNSGVEPSSALEFDSSFLEKIALNGDILTLYNLLEANIKIPEDCPASGAVRHKLIEVYRMESISPEQRRESIRTFLKNSTFYWAEGRDSVILSKKLGCFDEDKTVIENSFIKV